MAGKQQHPYHLVDPSPWPLVTSFAGGGLAVGAIAYMHYQLLWPMIAGLVAVILCMAMWWRDIVRESHQKHHTPVVQIGLRYGMLLFIMSEAMFFVAFFWAYFNASFFPVGGIWPPEGITTFDPFHLPLLNTLILLLSGCTLTWSHHALIDGDRKGFMNGLLYTIILGISFTCLQVVEYMHAPFVFSDGIYASAFYIATGFHGFHVIVGTLFLLVCYMRGRAGHFTAEQHVGFESAAWYWHFVDVVWLFLFVSIYWWGAGEIAAH